MRPAVSQSARFSEKICIHLLAIPSSVQSTTFAALIRTTMTTVAIDCTIRLADRSEAGVIAPARQQAIEPHHRVLGCSPRYPARGQLTDRPRHAAHTLARRTGADMGPSRLRRVTPSNGVAQKVDRLLRDTAQSVLSSFTSSFNRCIMARMTVIASCAVPRQQITKSSA